MGYVKALTLAGGIGCLAACGQKGPLVLPDKHPPTIAKPVTPAAPADAADAAAPTPAPAAPASAPAPQ